MINNFTMDKKQHIKEQIKSIQNNVRVLAKVGNCKPLNRDDEIKFQKERLKELEYIEKNSIEIVRNRERKLVEELGEYAELIGGDMTSLSADIVLKIAKVELLRLALSEVR